MIVLLTVLTLAEIIRLPAVAAVARCSAPMRDATPDPTVVRASRTSTHLGGAQGTCRS
ncbi:hypothetical protein ACFQX6_09795 [Streptosporangium lutulentum]